jgi:hypothetical protein
VINPPVTVWHLSGLSEKDPSSSCWTWARPPEIQFPWIFSAVQNRCWVGGGHSTPGSYSPRPESGAYTVRLSKFENVLKCFQSDNSLAAVDDTLFAFCASTLRPVDISLSQPVFYSN